MAKIQTGDELGMAILEALGIPSDKVVGVSIDMEPGRLASVTVVRHVDSDEVQKLVMELQKYDLVRQEDRVALPVVNMGMDKASGPDMTVMGLWAKGPRGSAISIPGPIKPAQYDRTLESAWYQPPAPDGTSLHVNIAAPVGLYGNGALTVQDVMAGLDDVGGNGPGPTEPTPEDPMEAIRALVKKHGGGSCG